MTTIALPWLTPPTRANAALRSTNPHARAASVRQMKTEAGCRLETTATEMAAAYHDKSANLPATERITYEMSL